MRLARRSQFECGPNSRGRRADIPHDELGVQMQDPIPEPLELPVPALIRRAANAVTAAIDFDDELLNGRQKIGDEAPADRHLPAEGNAQAARAKLVPQELLAPSGRGAQARGALAKELGGLD